MKNLNKNQIIAVVLALAFLAYIMFAGPIMNLFNPSAQDNNIQRKEANSGLQIQDEIVGTGLSAGLGDTLTVHYVGTLSDGRVFDSSLDRNVPFTFVVGVGQVIRGWDKGLLGMHVGGKRLLIIPPEYGYGSQEAGTIPPNSTLIFEIELLNVKKQ